MKKIIFVCTFLALPSFVFAGGYGGNWFMVPEEEKASSSEVQNKTTETNFDQSQSQYEPTVRPRVELGTTTPVTRERYNPYYSRMRSTEYSPYWWLSNRNDTGVVNRETTSKEVLDQKERRAQEKLLKYRSFLR